MSTVTNAADATKDPREIRRVVTSSFIGSTIEFYDFILYATAAAIVFGPVFFSTLDPLLATIASYLTFAAGYLARPIGGIVFGHFGDRIGRKRMLMVSLTVMGVASMLIGLVPPVEVWGAFLLLLLRMVQGIAIGGEWGGATLMALEHSSTSKRGFAASFANAGGPAGAFLGTAALALFALLPQDQFLAWGWRIPFLFSGALLVIGLYIRSRVSESPVFTAALQIAEATKARRPKVPIAQVFRRPGALLTVGLVGMSSFVLQAMFSTFTVGFAVESGFDRSSALWAFAVSQLIAAFTIPAAAALSDRIGRKPVMLGGLVLTGVLAFPLFALVATAQAWAVYLAFILALPLCQSLMFGPMAAFLAENFATSSRYTGASLGYQLAALLGAGFTPAIASTIFAAGGGDVTGVVWFLIGMCAISLVVLVVFGRESRHVIIDESRSEEPVVAPQTVGA
ncbi:MFS transporter [Microbacterium sp.]|uniref:MFS transporter n=1 Tax=Microbacterium sp. TaxID=51671 RepID=UPI002D778BE5|nr:MFS transporter [Microbacterium sp.]HET6302697.1 MFS transporter [Microbacterium sp.]